ncbi:MAG: flavin oxidoreductase [Saprospiraceae bacterium]|nr:flavin oxidoreductase [Saprospiraceae bacterium]
MVLQKEDIQKFEKNYLTIFVNSLAGYRQAVLVGTRSIEGVSNLGMFNSLIHLGASPALYGLISRPDSVKRDTLKNIQETKEYTFNFILSDQYIKAHLTSARYEKNVSEFEKVGFKEMYHPGFYAPFVKEAVFKIGMELEQIVELSINGTKLIIGSICLVEIENSKISSDGFVDLSDTLISQGLDAYFTAKEMGRLPYAKPLM